MFGLPAVLAKEAVVQIGTAVVVCIGAVVTHRTPEEFPTLPSHTLPIKEREPLAFGAAAATLLTGTPGIDLDRDNPLLIRLVASVLIDLAAKLVGLTAVHPPRLASTLRLDLAQPLKQQDAPGIARTDLGNPAAYLMGSIFIHAPDVSPQILVALLPFHRFPRLPLFFCDLFQMTIPGLIEPLIGEEKERAESRMLRVFSR